MNNNLDKYNYCTIFANKSNQMTQLEKDIRSHVISSIRDYIGEPVSDLHSNLFNTDYWVIGYYNAEKEILKHSSIFDAIAKIKEYEESEFGHCNTDLTSSEKVCNMLVYILGQECLDESETISENWDDDLTQDIADKIIEEYS